MYKLSSIDYATVCGASSPRDSAAKSNAMVAERERRLRSVRSRNTLRRQRRRIHKD